MDSSPEHLGLYERVEKSSEKLQSCFISVSFLHQEGNHGYDTKCCREQTAIASDHLWAIHSGLELLAYMPVPGGFPR